MTPSTPSFYITTPIYYVNDVPHIGHAYTTIAADVLARYRRLAGNDVFFLTGLDEHGQKVQRAAVQADIEPKQYCDAMVPRFTTLWERLRISHDAFIRTSDAGHEAVVRQKLQTLYEKNLIYSAEYSGWYCTFDERFWTEKDVLEGLCPECRRPVERLSEHNYFFRMSQFQGRLIKHLEDHPAFIQPEVRRNEVLGFLKRPLEDLSISRPKSRLSWGIELPFDSDYVTYVWFDALINYISALEYLLPASSFEHFWPATIHLVGKDILTTHAVYWSTILMALDLSLPVTIYAHGWWTVNGDKMSKSRGNVVDPSTLADTYGVDAFRYFLLREVPFGNDGDFSETALTGRINSDLANGIGNLLSRTLTLIERSCQARIPSPEASSGALERELEATATRLPDLVEEHMSRLQFHRALEAIWGLVQLGNQYLERTAPWTLARHPEQQARLHTVLYHAAETLRCLCVAIYPFMPQAASAMSRQLGLEFMLNFTKPILAGELAWGGLIPGTPIGERRPLFPRVDTPSKPLPAGPRRVSGQQPTPRTSERPSTPEPNASQISLHDFQNVHLKAARIIAAERIPKSSKLLKLQVDVGEGHRQIVAGIGKKYHPEDLLGRMIVIVANLKPAKLMNVESQGMVLAAGDKEVEGLVTLPDDVPPGTKVK